MRNRYHDGVAADLLQRLRGRQWRLTPQRRVVAEVLAGDHIHLTAEQVHELAQARLPEISRATVYNTLNELVAIGEVAEVDVTDGPKRYDPNVVEDHDHLVCESCHAIRDVPHVGERPVVAKGARAGFLITGVDITYRGLCPDCARRHQPVDA
jgi:Fur family transcriptional regulator, stress-responsive regulator